MVSRTYRAGARAILIVSIVVMLSVAVFKMFWLIMGTLVVNHGPIPRIYLLNIIEAPLFLVSGLTAWKWPWVAELAAALTVIAILTRMLPPPVFPYRFYLSWEFAFIIAANTAFFSTNWLRTKQKPA